MSQDFYYNSRYTFDSRRKIVWKEIVKFLQKYISKDSMVVDWGAGYCDFINNVLATKKYAIDISPELKNCADKDIAQINRGGFDFPEVQNSSVDVCFASNFLEHFVDEDLEKIIKEVKRILKPNGKFILMQPNFSLQPERYFDDYTHKKIFTENSLESFLFANGFKIILKKARFLPMEMKDSSSIIPNFLLPLIVRIYIHSPIKPFAGQMLFISQKP